MSNLPFGNLSLREICAMVEGGQAFSLTRYGDGEFYWMLDRPGFVSRSGHESFAEGNAELRDTLSKRPAPHHAPLYYCGPVFFREYGTEERKVKWRGLVEWVREHAPDVMWQSNLIFVGPMEQCAKERRVYPLLTTLRQQPNVVIVGPHWLRKLNEPSDTGKTPLKYKAFVEVPAKNCYLVKDHLRRQIVDLWERLPHPIFFSLSCSYTANLLVHELYDTVGRDCWLVDTGSVWDNYVGVIQRRFQANIVRKHGGVVL